MLLYDHKGFNNLLKRTTKGYFKSNGLDLVVCIRCPNCKVNPTTVDANKLTLSKKTQ